MTRSVERFLPFVALLAMIATPAAEADDRIKRFALAPGTGDALTIVDEGSPAGGGFSSGLYTMRGGFGVGSFTTDIISGEIIDNVLGQLAVGGPGTMVQVEAVTGTFQTAFGTIFDVHKPTVIVLNEPTSILSSGLVMVAVAEGTITGGSGIFKRISGASSLYLRFEVDPANNFETAVVSGSFTFTLD